MLGKTTAAAATTAAQSTLTHVAQTGSVPAAAAALFLSVDTVKSPMKNVYRKPGVASRQEAITLAAEMGLLNENSE